VTQELQTIEQWASGNNLKLNITKSQEMIVFASAKAAKMSNNVLTIPNVTRVNSLTVLGVTLESNLSMKTHVDNICQSAAQSMFAVKSLKVRGLDTQSTHDVCKATVVSRLMQLPPGGGLPPPKIGRGFKLC